MKALRRKLWRDLWNLRGQVVAVALVAAVGVANLVMSRATLESLQASRERFYREGRFADVFADLHRAPESVGRELARIEGVATLETRILASGRAELEGYHEPIGVQAVGLPETGAPRLNRVHVRAGRLPGPEERRAILVSDAFAQAHSLRPGASLVLVLHGRRQAFRVVGIGTSPEFVSQMAPATIFPDAHRYVIAWMPHDELAAATDMDGAFNSLALTLLPGARAEPVIRALDAALARYGGAGAITREDQRSHRYLSEEFRQLGTMARIFPAVFLAVSAFVLYVVLARLVAVQREQIGVLKAFGYRSGELWRHYAGFALVVGLAGAALGIALGLRLGQGMAELYREFYRLPQIDFSISLANLLLATGVCVASALAGALLPVWRAARLPAAEAMRTEVPPRAGRLVRAAGTSRWSQSHRLIWRSLQARPLRSALACLGMAAGTAIMMMARFQGDAIDEIVERQFMRAERHDLAASFFEPQAGAALDELRRLPGVTRVEGERLVPVELRFRNARYRTVLRSIEAGAQLRRVNDAQGRPLASVPRHLLLTDYLGRLLGAKPGDRIEMQVLDGRRQSLRIRLGGLVPEPFGAQAYLPADALQRELGEGPRFSIALLRADARALPALVASLAKRPAVASVDQRLAAIRNFYAGMADTILFFTMIATAFGVAITAGVVYSSARVALSERARDLASLRVLGFSTGEVGYLLLGELALLVLLSVPVGFALGNGLIALLVTGYESDLFRIPHHVSADTYGLAGTTTLVAALCAAGLVWPRVRRLDLVGVLKARD